MTEPTGEAAVAALLREVGRVLHSGEADPEQIEVATEALQKARDALAGGPQRLRWYEVDGVEAGRTRARNRELSAFTGSLNILAPPMTIRPGALDDGRPALIGSVRLDRLREGPPRSVHGGVLAGLFDELLGAGLRLCEGPPGVTGRLTVRYRRPTPLDTDLELRVWIHDERTRRIVVRGECLVAGAVTAEAEAVFLRVDFDKLDQQMRTRPEGAAPSAAPPRSTRP